MYKHTHTGTYTPTHPYTHTHTRTQLRMHPPTHLPSLVRKEIAEPWLHSNMISRYYIILQHTGPCCNTLKHAAKRCNTLQHTATHCYMLQLTASYCNILQRTAALCNTLHHAAPYCNTLQHTATHAGEFASPHESKIRTTLATVSARGIVRTHSGADVWFYFRRHLTIKSRQNLCMLTAHFVLSV